MSEEKISLEWLGDRVMTMSAELRDLRHRIDGLERRMSALEHRFIALEDRFGVMEHRIGAMEERFAVQEERMSGSWLSWYGSPSGSERLNQPIEPFQILDAQRHLMHGKAPVEVSVDHRRDGEFGDR